MEIKEHDIVQITDETHPWFPALLVVTEVKAWGIVGFAYMPMDNLPGSYAGRIFDRLETGRFARVGRVVILSEKA